MIKNRQPRWQPISMLPLLAELIDDSLSDAQDMLENVQRGVSRPYVFDDHTVDRILRLYHETLELTVSYKGQLERWSEETSDPVKRAEIDRLTSLVPELRETSRAIINAALEIRKSTINSIMELDDVVLGMAALSGKGFRGE